MGKLYTYVSEIEWVMHEEMARDVEDVLERRVRPLYVVDACAT
jgi:glycerol-3-phosphate dehydrogenase